MRQNRWRAVSWCLLWIFLLVGFYHTSHAKFNMSYLYGSYDYLSLVERTKGALNEVSPSYFDLKEDGSLSLNVVDTQLLNSLYTKGMTVVPFLSNHWDRSRGRIALQNREKLATQIVNAVQKYQLDGVNVDLENLTEKDRDNYTDFVRILKEKLPYGKTLSVAVAANPNGWNTGWQGSYDYAELGKLVDYMMLMAYDEHFEGGTEGPVASIDFVERSIQYALQYVPKEKLVLGVPFYGRYWNADTGEGGYGVRTTRIEELLQKYSSNVVYDEQTASVKATITIRKGQTCPVINGRTLVAGTYTFWYENEKSLTAKLALIKKYDLKGSGSWSLGQEPENTWDYYEKVVNGEDTKEVTHQQLFTDVPENYWAKEAILVAKEKGWVTGRTENTFAPEGTLTRAEFATMICRILGLSYSQTGEYYLDISHHWAKDSINAMSQAGLINGYGNGLFLPDNPITREEVAKVLYFLTNGECSNQAISFTDVGVNRWSYAYIRKLSALGIVNGYGNGEFRPQNPIKRAEIVTILQRMFD